jgi:hypothetical protein
VCCDERGLATFQLLRHRRNEPQAFLYAFDLLELNAFAALLEEQISEKISRRILSGDQGMIVWWSIGAGVHVEPHSHANEQIV